MVPSVSFRSITDFKFCAYVLNFQIDMQNIKHFKGWNCLCFFVFSNVPTTEAFLLCVLINIFIWFDFTEIALGYTIAFCTVTAAFSK